MNKQTLAGQELNAAMMTIFEQFGQLKEQAPAEESVQKLVGTLQNFISQNFYPCSKADLADLGPSYERDSDFALAIDRAGGVGTARFVAAAIKVYCADNRS
ncbi:TipAS antibiotic-recognition domain-containing protein [Lactobacillus sp. DCY120]|uniref:TipAS antibiotic-recognition domain-containing protein n=1 Tax=Bombilactobacillus apium TaxID=2675299 RepID=A0A850R421_9LACO|nr:TipAS antibiotic-recognition domain-containing protein [Bombilactobacillus apium]NVY96721.1 TipAS antibiotic-recognition domain-containing protein [Bombilactobacillus apium]